MSGDCLIAHGAAPRQELGDPVLGDRIILDWRRAGLDQRREAIRNNFTNRLSGATGMLPDEEYHALALG